MYCEASDETRDETRITCEPSPRLEVLTPDQRDAYRRDGFLAVEAFVDPSWIERLCAVTAEYVDQSRAMTESNAIFDLEPDHTASEPRLRRLVSPADLHETFWEFASCSPIVDLIADLIGPDIKFHHSKLNFKSPRGGEEVKWHQDIQFWPHTNYSPLTVGVFLSDVAAEMGNVGFIPGSHLGELHDQYDGERWVGCIGDADLAQVDTASAIYPTGPAGSITIHNCRTIHGSAPNRSDAQRPLLLQTYSAADAFVYTDIVRRSPHGDMLIRGEPARWARHDPRPCQVGPSRVRTIFEVQQRET